MLQRTLESEFSEDESETRTYDEMDHVEVNQSFIEDLIQGGPVGPDILDLGTGTARIPVMLCQRLQHVRVMAVDASASMLDIAKVNVNVGGVVDRVQLEQGDAKEMQYFESDMFDSVLSNSLLHHLPDPAIVFPLFMRLVRPGGRIFIRDLMRPNDQATVESLVSQYTAGMPCLAVQLFRQSLHAALTLDEVKDRVQTAGMATESVVMTSDRHWTFDQLVS